MTIMLYMPENRTGEKEGNPNYIREFDAIVEKVGDDYVVLDKSAFYPLGGGQPSDVGKMTWEGGEAKVSEVTKKGIVRHKLEGGLPELGIAVHAVLDWELRYAHMKTHTAQHVISGVVYDMFGARTVGNQIYANKSRVDFAPLTLEEGDLQRIEEECNRIIGEGRPVSIYEEDRDALAESTDAVRSNLDLIPVSFKRLRVISIKDFDVVPCAGTHVANTREIGSLKITKKESKGKGKIRISYDLI